jgi:hypothetical protein
MRAAATLLGMGISDELVTTVLSLAYPRERGDYVAELSEIGYRRKSQYAEVNFVEL